MATYDLEEQEKLDEFKAWWKRWGTLVMLGAAALVAAGAGWQWWQYKQQTQLVEAAAAYEKLADALQKNDGKTARSVAAALTQTYADTAFAPRAALLLAKLEVLDNKPRDAIKQLEWVVAHTTEASLRDLARLRAASLLLDEKQYAAALKHLDAPHANAFKGRFLDLKGDVLLAQRKNAEAHKAYSAAFDALSADNPYRPMVEIKKDATR